MAIQVKKISKSFGDRNILEGIDLYLANGDRAGLIGPNGCGKTTLVRIIAGLMDKDDGSVSVPKDNFTLGYLEQFADIIPGTTLMQEAMRGAEKLNFLEKKLRALEERMAGEDMEEVESASKEYSEVMARFEQAGGYTFETVVKSILTGLGFRENDWVKPAGNLSGGEKTRLSLARLLADKPDFILLDEPTNHLDLPAIEWLESTLKGFDGGYLIISHDRRFLDACCPVLFELEGGKISRYTGGYEGFLTQKAQKLERESRMIHAQEKEIAQLKKFIARWSKDKLKASMAMSRKKKLDKIEASKVEASKREKAGMSLRFESSVKSYDEVVTLRNIRKTFGKRVLLEDIGFSVRNSERFAIIGRNGTGKTTLLRMMIREEKPDSGEIWWGDRVVWGYFSQTMEELDHENTVYNELIRLGRNISGQDALNLLGRFLFSGDDIEKQVGDLSGGERSKLMFAILLTRRPNCMILDEPTNHLDLPSREILEEALEEYDGTLIFVSHDRAFIDRLASHTLELEDGHAKRYVGNYSDVLYRKQQIRHEKDEAERLKRREELDEERREKARQKRRRKTKPDSGSGEKEKTPADIMDEIELIEKQIETLMAELNLPEVYLDYEKASDINKSIAGLQDSMDDLFAELEVLMENND